MPPFWNPYEGRHDIQYNDTGIVTQLWQSTNQLRYNKFHFLTVQLSVITLNGIRLSVINLNGIRLSVIILNGIRLSVIILNVVAHYKKLRWVVWTSKSDLSTRTKCDQNQISDTY